MHALILMHQSMLILQVPFVTSENAELLGNNTLVRFRGMVRHNSTLDAWLRAPLSAGFAHANRSNVSVHTAVF